MTSGCSGSFCEKERPWPASSYVNIDMSLSSSGYFKAFAAIFLRVSSGDSTGSCCMVHMTHRTRRKRRAGKRHWPTILTPWWIHRALELARVNRPMKSFGAGHYWSVLLRPQNLLAWLSPSTACRLHVLARRGRETKRGDKVQGFFKKTVAEKSALLGHWTGHRCGQYTRDGNLWAVLVKAILKFLKDEGPYIIMNSQNLARIACRLSVLDSLTRLIYLSINIVIAKLFLEDPERSSSFLNVASLTKSSCSCFHNE